MRCVAVSILLLVLSAGHSVFGQESQGTVFHSGSMKELKRKAEKEGKYLFVEVSASWSGPGKYMTNKIFPQPEVGNFINTNFIPAKFDAEKGEGVEITQQYSVHVFPTYLILDSRGYQVGRVVGGGVAMDFLRNVKESLAAIPNN